MKLTNDKNDKSTTNSPESESKSADVSRRDFVEHAAKTAAALAIAPMIVPRHVLGRGHQAPSDTVNFASIGIGGMGMENLKAMLRAGQNCVAICDIDFPYVERSLEGNLRPRTNGTAEEIAAHQQDVDRLQAAYTRAVKYADFRQMLERQKDIDAVIVATPDHLHATIAHAAMQMKKHAYVQKPLTFSVYEARLLARTAKENKVVTQMGNQGHSREGTRRINEWIAAGVIGPVHEVHVWTDRPLVYWPQGIPRPGSGRPPAPQATLASGTPPHPRQWSMGTVNNAILAAMAAVAQEPPQGLHWDLFLGPAQEIAYHPVYHPFTWRGWPDFGVSAIGDMGAHLIDQPFWALGLQYPTSIVSTSTPWGAPKNTGSYPLSMMSVYEFPARGHMPPVKLTWYDGNYVAPVSAEVPRPGGDGGGGIFVGEKGYITYETYGDNPKVYPESVAAAAEQVPKTFPRVTGSHEQNFVEAIQGKTQSSSPFEYAAKLTETMLLGVVALKAGNGRKLQYDGDNMRVTNVPEANADLTREYRKGWEL